MSKNNTKTSQKSKLEKRIDAVAWGLFLIMIGGLWLAPEGSIPEGTWLIGAGIIILGLSYFRYINRIKISGFWIFLGLLALGSGLGDFFGLDLPVFPILLVIFGASIILKSFFEKN